MRHAPLLCALLLLAACAPHETVRIAAWNLHVYGDTKASDPALLDAYADVIARYDIVVLQEVRDKDGSSIAALCDRLDGYACNASSRAGRSATKEQYVLAYRNATLLELTDYNPDPEDRWERPPIRATFRTADRTVTLYAIHTKPDDATREIGALASLVGRTREPGSTIVLGDLNADCAYYDPGDDTSFDGWRWAIREDTTTGRTECAYDRIITDMRYARAGVDTDGVTPAMSDHYPVWISLT